MGSLGAIYKPETVCPFALTYYKPLKPDFVPFWFKRVNPISLVAPDDSYNGSLYILHRTLTLANRLNWISRGIHIVPEALHTCIATNAHSGRVTPNGKGSIHAIHDITSCRTVIRCHIIVAIFLARATIAFAYPMDFFFLLKNSFNLLFFFLAAA